MNTEPHVALIGAGNLATNLGKALQRSGIEVVQVFSRTEQSAEALAAAIGCGWTTSIAGITKDADIYIVSLTDSALQELAARLVSGREHALWVHTAGSMPMDTLPCQHRGVLYPMQTFSKGKEVDFSVIPLFIEAELADDEALLSRLAHRLTDSVRVMSSADRRYLHLAAVFCCNFANHCYAIGQCLLREHGDIPFGAMLPLIEETTRKLYSLSPREGQTGPAVRWDENVIGKHLDMLADEPQLQAIYKMMSESIHTFNTTSSTRSTNDTRDEQAMLHN